MPTDRFVDERWTLPHGKRCFWNPLKEEAQPVTPPSLVNIRCWGGETHPCNVVNPYGLYIVVLRNMVILCYGYINDGFMGYTQNLQIPACMSYLISRMSDSCMFHRG